MCCGLFQVICRVNQIDGEDKEYGCIVDYKDLFHSLETSIGDYTSGAFDAYDQEDVKGLLTDRLVKGKERLEEARETTKALCEPVMQPKALIDYIRYFCGDVANSDDLKINEAKRVSLYKKMTIGNFLKPKVLCAAAENPMITISSNIFPVRSTAGKIKKIMRRHPKPLAMTPAR